MATRSSVESVLIIVFLPNAFLGVGIVASAGGRSHPGSPQSATRSTVVGMLESKKGPALSVRKVVTSTRRPDLVGRRRERELLEEFLGSARGGRGAVLVVHGEPGVGKTALLEYAVGEADSFRIARTVGVEGEIELPFAALQQLCAPILELRT